MEENRMPKMIFSQELEEMSKGENIVKWIKDKLARSPGENGGKQNAQDGL
jgi:hypothetical protein